MSNLKAYFEKVARKISEYAGKPLTFTIAFIIVVIWAVTGPLFGYSDTWQLVINTGTTIITFLMVFLVQSAQNRDSKAVQLKLDELIYKLHRANNIMIDIENLSDDELTILAEKYRKIRTSGDVDALEELKSETRAATKQHKTNTQSKTSKSKPAKGNPKKSKSVKTVAT